MKWLLGADVYLVTGYFYELSQCEIICDLSPNRHDDIQLLAIACEEVM